MTIDSSFKSIQEKYLQRLPEIFDELEGLILQIEKGENVDESFREFNGKVHSLKGSAGTFDLDVLSTICHKLEDFLSQPETVNSPKTCQTILNMIDLMSKYTKEFNPEDSTQEEQYINIMREILGEEFDGLRVLICGEFPLLNKKIQNVFNQLHSRLSYARNGYEALGRLIHEDFDLLITSFESDIIKGPTLAKMIRINEEIYQNLKIILVTSYEEVYQTQGIDMIVKKDTNIEESLKSAYQQLFEK